MRASLYLSNAQQANDALKELWKTLKPWLIAGHRFEVEVRPERRSSEANARMWAMLNEVSQQVEWYGKKLTPEDWKHVFSASLRKLDVVPNIDGTGFVALGMSTSQMSKKEHSDLMTLIEAFGAERGVTFKEPETA
jgi:sulfite reductase beta subunit-like hemoprotein